MRRLLHPLRLLSRAVTLAWLWRNRHDIIRWAKFLVALPAEAKVRDRSEILAEARARAALTMDPRTRLASDLDIDHMGDGTVVVRTHLERPTAQVAREVLERVPGVRNVDVIDLTQPDDETLANAVPVTATPAGS